jgi:hypothetical protein
MPWRQTRLWHGSKPRNTAPRIPITRLLRGLSLQGENMGIWKNGLAVLGVAALLSGCATPLPRQQAYDRVGHAQIRTIHVLPAPQVKLRVFMMHNIAGSFGLIGALLAAGNESDDVHRLMDAYHAAPLHPRQYFQAALTKALSARGYKVVWPALDEEEGVKHGNSGLRVDYSPVTDADAILDVDLNFFGYAAGGPGKDSPYRPTATATARLVSADGKQTYFTDYFAYNNIFDSTIAVTIEPDPRFAYPKFVDLEHAGIESKEGLELALSGLAQKLASEL